MSTVQKGLIFLFLTLLPLNKAFSEDKNSSDFSTSRLNTSTASSLLFEKLENSSSLKDAASDLFVFNETEGSVVGKVVFNFSEKNERLRLKEENKWITVDENGEVKVKEIWDYERLDGEKTINFSLLATVNATDEERLIVFKLLDVNDEYPYFVNTPLPMNAIVPLNAPPGTVVFKLLAKDDDADSEIHFFITKDECKQTADSRNVTILVSAAGRFEVDSLTGDIRTRINATFSVGKEYALHVVAEDRKGSVNNKLQRTSEERISIIGGRRPPQFYKPMYNVTVYTNTSIDTEVIQVRAISFTSRDIKYILSPPSIFNIESMNGTVTVAKNLSDDDVNEYSFIVKAFELPDGFSSAAELRVNIELPKQLLDDTKPANFFASIDEDVPIGTAILRLPIAEKGTGLLYSLDRSEFSIDEAGVILSTKRLDADTNGTYLMNVNAFKKGDLSKKTVSAAVVNVQTANKNDEAPTFEKDLFIVEIDERTGPNAIVAKVNANDIDGDKVFYQFKNGKTTFELFTIENKTGEIRTLNNKFSFDKSQYELVIFAKDDGSCCRRGPQTLHTSTATVIISVIDVNDHKPIFKDCETYLASVEEGAPKGTHVITVKATDDDKGLNSEVRYSIAQQWNQRSKKFVIDERSGVVRTNKVFDREGDDKKFEMVTVKAWDNGTPSLEGVCTFKVDIVDKNDNSPLFERLEYHVKVKKDTAIGVPILKVSATDEDSDLNGDITYSLAIANNSADLHYFRINPSTGWISVRQLLSKSHYYLKAVAADSGRPANKVTVDVSIEALNSGNNPPVWSQTMFGPATIKENLEVGKLILTMKAVSGIPDNPILFYEIIDGNEDKWTNREMFFISQRLENGITYADLHLYRPLDYERTQLYTLVVRATNNGETQLYADTEVSIVVEDVNDEIPHFDPMESIKVMENMPPGTKVTKLTATDLDVTSPNNKVMFVIESPTESDNHFSIDRETGEIFTKIQFDRESRAVYSLGVKAFDAAPSAITELSSTQKPNFVTKFIRIEIEDENDNLPYFEKQQYEVEVSENEDAQYSVITTAAKDKDHSSRLEYNIVAGNDGEVFAIREFTGEIYVSGNIDYEVKHEYTLRVAVSDGLNQNYTNVNVYIKDVNDKPPIFEHPTYAAYMTVEENRKLPRKILQVKATDGDTDQNSPISYFLSGNPANNHHFSIDATTGDVFVLKPLDKALQSSRAEWRFTVFAADEKGYGLLGYAEVVVFLKGNNDKTFTIY